MASRPGPPVDLASRLEGYRAAAMRLLTRPDVRTTVATAAALACALVPVFLFGALSELIRADLVFDEAGVGAGVTVFFVAAGLGAVPGGRITERVGPRVAMLLGASIAGVASFGIGLLAQQWWQAALLLAVAGSAVGLIDTGGARAFADVVPSRRQGLAFGIKEASVPAASMLAGAAVPLLGLTVGWRATFALGLLLAPLVWLVLPPQVGAGRPPGAVPVGHRRPSRRVLLLIALGSAAGTGAATATASFLVPAATVAGLAAGTAGTLLAIGSLLSITARIVAGHLADGARRRELTVTAGMLAVGTAGPLLLASDLRTAAVVGGLVALGAGWGWTGLVFLSAVRADPAAPAAAAGIVLAGLSTGGALGPIAFGVVVSQVGYQVAWLLAALAMAIGAVAIYAANRSSHPSPENTTA
jgi:predicted MFS family arabinose efflux permease